MQNQNISVNNLSNTYENDATMTTDNVIKMNPRVCQLTILITTTAAY